jgi:hypothetical protein
VSQGSRGRRDEEDETREPEIIWVGEQRLMEGYCGRAPAPTTQAQTGDRPIAVVKTRAGQGKVVRIGPPRTAAA